MHPAALAALPFKIPIAHIHGGELTQGAIDDALRHSITKLAHFHFVATKEYARRVIQLGEEPWRVTVSGAPSLDNLNDIQLLSVDELETQYGLDLQQPPLLVTFHPVTLEYEQTQWQISELLKALSEFDLPIIFTLPNADTNGRIIIQAIETFVRNCPSAWIFENLGTVSYFSLMNVAAAMVGNSSSGIIEAASFKLPVVNIGTRQKGRFRNENVIDTDYDCIKISQAIDRSLSLPFRDCLTKLQNLYGVGDAANSIVNKLKEIPLTDKLITKQFYDLTFRDP